MNEMWTFSLSGFCGSWSEVRDWYSIRNLFFPGLMILHTYQAPLNPGSLLLASTIEPVVRNSGILGMSLSLDGGKGLGVDFFPMACFSALEVKEKCFSSVRWGRKTGFVLWTNQLIFSDVMNGLSFLLLLYGFSIFF